MIWWTCWFWECYGVPLYLLVLRMFWCNCFSVPVGFENDLVYLLVLRMIWCTCWFGECYGVPLYLLVLRMFLCNCFSVPFGLENDLVYLLVLRRPRCWMRRLHPRWTGWRFDFLWCEVDQQLRVSAWLWFINGIGGGVRLWFAIRGHDIKPSNRIMFMFQVKLPHLWIQWWVVLINFLKFFKG